MPVRPTAHTHARPPPLQPHSPEWHICPPKDEPKLTRHNHAKSTVYLRGRAWHCTFSGFGPTRVCQYSIPRSVLQALNASALCLVTPRTHPGGSRPLHCLPSIIFSSMSYSCNHTVCRLFRLASFTEIYLCI